MGYVDAFDTIGAIAALEMALTQQGYGMKIGAGVSAATAVFADKLK